MRGGAKSPARELPYNGVFRIKDGVVTLLLTDEQNPAEFPNGIVFSPDEKYLYLTAGFGKTMRYRIQVSTVDAACRIVAANLAIAVVPREGAAAFQKALGLKIVPLQDRWARRRFVIQPHPMAREVSAHGRPVQFDAVLLRAKRVVLWHGILLLACERPR